MADWGKYGPARHAAVLDGIRKFTNTRNHDNMDHERVKEMLTEMRAAVDEAEGLFNFPNLPRDEDIDTSDIPESTSEDFANMRQENHARGYDIPLQGVPRFVQLIPDNHFPAWALHFANRMVDKAVDQDVGAGVDTKAVYGKEKTGPKAFEKGKGWKAS